jgi:hypothetical protein
MDIWIAELKIHQSSIKDKDCHYISAFDEIQLTPGMPRKLNHNPLPTRHPPRQNETSSVMLATN